MKVVTNLTKLDLIRYNFLAFPRVMSTYKSIVILSTLTFLYICWSNGFPQSEIRWGFAIAISLLCGVLGVLFGFFYGLIWVLLISKEKNGVLGHHEYSISIEGLHEKTHVNEGLSNWIGIEGVDVYGHYLFFKIPGNMCHILPKRFFQNKTEFEEFVSLSKQYWGKEHNEAGNEMDGSEKPPIR